MMWLIAARQARLFEEPGYACSTRERLIAPGGIHLERYYKCGWSPARMERAQVKDSLF